MPPDEVCVPRSDTEQTPLLQPEDADAAVLRKMGYKQELKRDLSLLSNFAVSFSIISILTGITGTFGSTGLTYGGPVGIVYGWLIVCFFTFLVGLGLAEICSAYPTSGGLYFWAYKLAGPEWGPFASWMTGWMNLLGQFAVTAGVAFTLANLVAAIILIATGGSSGGGYVCQPADLLSIYGGILLSQGILNTFSLHLLVILSYVSVLWNSLGVIFVVIALPLMARKHQSAEWVFTHFETANAAAVGVHNTWYVFLLGLLLGQYTIGGYDASAHMVEETKDAAVSGPAGIVVSIGTSALFGFAYILSMLFSISDPAWVVSPANDAGGYAAAQIYYDAVHGRIGGPGGVWATLGLLMIPAGAMYFCGLSCVTGNSRMLYAFSRDGAVPLSRLWHRVDPRTQNPTNAVWGMVGLSFLLGLPMLYDLQSFNAIISLSAIGLYLSYAAPILLRTTLGRTRFEPGPFNLGKASPFVCWAAVMWVAFITVLFCLPTVYPIVVETFNYAGVMVLAVVGSATVWWFLGARTWFKGPVSNLTAEEEQEILHQPFVSVP